MKCVSFNVNSIRMRFHQLEALVDKHAPDFIGLQETKVTDDDFPIEEIDQLGYHVEFFGQKTHYGVALLSKYPFEKVTKGFEHDEQEAQRRFICGQFTLENHEVISILNGYFPQGESRKHPTKFPNKASFYQGVKSHIENHHALSENIILMGDINVSHQDIDIGIGEDNKKRWLRTGKCSFLPEEREWLQAILDLGMHDTYRTLFPEKDDVFSWFDYRSKGFDREPKRGLRIDSIMASQSLNSRCVDAGIDYEIRAMEKPSDHCPIWSEFQLDTQ